MSQPNFLYSMQKTKSGQKVLSICLFLLMTCIATGCSTNTSSTSQQNADSVSVSSSVNSAAETLFQKADPNDGIKAAMSTEGQACYIALQNQIMEGVSPSQISLDTLMEEIASMGVSGKPEIYYNIQDEQITDFYYINSEKSFAPSEEFAFYLSHGNSSFEPLSNVPIDKLEIHLCLF